MIAEEQSQAKYENEFPADSSRLSDIRRISTAHARLWGIEDEAVNDAVLIADELFANAVRHGSTSADDEVTLSLLLKKSELRIAVADTVPGTPRRRLASNDDTRGRGLFLVDALAAKWGVEPQGDGKCTWAVLALPPAPTGGTHRPLPDRARPPRRTAGQHHHPATPREESP